MGMNALEFGAICSFALGLPPNFISEQSLWSPVVIYFPWDSDKFYILVSPCLFTGPQLGRDLPLTCCYLGVIRLTKRRTTLLST